MASWALDREGFTTERVFCGGPHRTSLFLECTLDVSYRTTELALYLNNYQEFHSKKLQNRSASPADVSFWSIHPTLDRLTQYKRLVKPFAGASWDKFSCCDAFGAPRRRATARDTTPGTLPWKMTASCDVGTGKHNRDRFAGVAGRHSAERRRDRLLPARVLRRGECRGGDVARVLLRCLVFFFPFACCAAGARITLPLLRTPRRSMRYHTPSPKAADLRGARAPGRG